LQISSQRKRGRGCVPKVFTEIGGNPVELKTVRLGVISVIKPILDKQLRFFLKMNKRTTKTKNLQKELKREGKWQVQTENDRSIIELATCAMKACFSMLFMIIEL